MLNFLFNNLNESSLVLSATFVDGTITCVLELGDRPPISFSNPSETFEQNFIAEISEAFKQTAEVRSSINFFKKQLELKEKQLKDKATNAKSLAKPTTTAPATPSLFDSNVANQPPIVDANDETDFDEDDNEQEI